MWKPETIKKMLDDINSRTASWNLVEVHEVPMCLSQGDVKIGRVLNVSLPPILSCGRCSHCSGHCYDVGSCIRFEEAADARARNWSILLRDRDLYFQKIDLKMTRRRKHLFMRWHQGGEIVDYDYFCRMVENARKHSRFRIWTYTKMYHIVNRWCDLNGGKEALPSNFVVMFSKWDGVPMDNPYNFPTFTCRLLSGNKDTPEEYFKTTYKCPGNCDVCKELHRGCIYGESVWTDEHGGGAGDGSKKTRKKKTRKK